ncbi:cell division protein FtsQ/DivIB [Thalassomonas sp. RHCl1]|uniref:cell division protein FtsQ/DivIB n=1 Tax=Thalassomonas sp. RHCl1 TaxID=2995320 RepID=UPI00248C8E51|nr:cell division protein FtsQ/DivIB [Thalassomonas sp. RHCl1]
MAKAAGQIKDINWSFWSGVVFFVLVVVGLLYLSWYISQEVNAEESAPVTTLAIGGEMPYTNRQDILTAIDDIDMGNFFQVDVNRVQQQIMTLPWVYSVSVRKQWPNELKIYVVDQTPVALWNGDFLINREGKAFQADTGRLTSPLPQFYGPEGSEIVALDNFRNLNALLEFRGLAIAELMLSERFSWQLTLNDGVVLNLGREERVERIQRFMDVYPQIKQKKEENQQVDYIDLRYDTGVAVGWKPAADKQRA